MAGQVLERAVLKAADLFRVEGLLEHCVEAFGRGLKVNTAVEQLVWAHNHGPAEARTVATEYFVGNGRRIQVGYEDLCVVPCVVKTFEHLCLRTRIATARKASRGGLYTYNSKPIICNTRAKGLYTQLFFVKGKREVELSKPATTPVQPDT